MTTINFPSDPILNQTYQAGTRKWSWNGVYWKAESPTDRVGYTGSQGDLGYTGSQGPAGTSVRIVGVVATSGDLPASYLGDVGDGYIVQSTGFLWVWDGADWIETGRITGYTGSQGDLGYTGSQGTGYTGSQGDVGYSGSVGYTGSQGDVGFAGSQGDVGYSGSVGYTGSQGDVGYTGSQGDVGYTGSQGESSFVYGSTPPENPEVGDRWFDTADAAELVWTYDGDSGQWVEVVSSGFVGYTGSAGTSAPSNIPPVDQTSTYILSAGDVGKYINITTGGVTVPEGVFVSGDIVSIYNNSSSTQTITQGANVTMYQVGTAITGNRSLVQRGLATILCVGSNEFVITGGGMA